MNRHILLCFVCILCAAGAVAQTDVWRTVVTPEFDRGLYDVYFVDGRNGWLVADSGEVFRTTNGGVQWTQQTSGSKARLRKVFFRDLNNGWIAAERRTILRTTNGGTSWSTVQLPTTDSTRITYSLSFISATQGWAVCGKSSASEIYMTTDGGGTWTSQKTLTKPLYDVHFASATHGAAVGNDFTLLQYTTDGGTTWTASTKPDYGGFTYTSNTLNCVYMIDDNTVVASGWGSWFQTQPTMVYRSTNGGSTYAFQVQPSDKRTYGSGQDLYFKDKNNGLLVGGQRGALLLKTTDGGITWNPLPPLFGHILYAIGGSGDSVVVIGRSGFIARSTNFGDTWQILTTHHADAVKDIAFTGGSTGFMTMSNATVKKTTDGGQTWSLLPQVTAGVAPDNIMAAQWVNSSVAYVGQDYGQTAKTTDGGQTWSTVIPALPSFQSATRGLHFLSATQGAVIRSNGVYAADQVQKTTDGGTSWVVKDSIMMKQPKCICFYDATHGIIAGASRSLRYTTDGGSTWQTPAINGHPATVAATGDINAVTILDATHAWAAGSRAIYRSSDLGATWEYVAHGYAGSDTLFYGIGFKNATVGYAVGYRVMLKTTDGGTTWASIPDVAAGNSLYGPAFDPAGNAWVYSATGRTYTTSVAVSVDPIGDMLPGSFSLEQNYPNPFNPATSIAFTLGRASRASLKVFDILGREVALVANGQYPAGTHTVEFDARTLSSGVYIYRLDAEGFTDVRKMVFMK